LPDPSLLILGPAFDAAESSRSVDNLNRVDLPDAVKIVVTRGKFDAGVAVTTFNIDAGYPPEIAALQTVATMAGRRFRDDARFRDGYDFFCIRRLLDKRGGFDRLLLLRDPVDLEQGWPGMAGRAATDLFAVDGETGRNLLLNLAEPRSRAFLTQAWALYATGAAFAIPCYSLATALGVACDAVDLVASLAPGLTQ
jgi:hypothetical protein